MSKFLIYVFKCFNRSLFLFCGFITTCWAGAWVQPEGDGINITSFRYYRSYKYWDSNGHLQRTPTFAKSEIENYLEYGVTNKLTLALDIDGQRAHSASTDQSLTGLNGNKLLARYALWQQGTQALAAQAFINVLGRAAQLNIPAQNGSINTGEALIYGISGTLGHQAANYWFADVSTEIVQRYGYGDQAKVDADVGWKTPQNRWWFLLKSFNTLSLANWNYPTDSNYNLYTVEPSVLYWFAKPFALQVGADRDIYGKNIGQGTTLFLATWFKF